MSTNNSPSVFLELPHGGTLIPEEVAPFIDSHFQIAELREDADEFSDMLFHKLDAPHYELRGEYWRGFIDFNRRIDDRGSDGVVKTHTSQGIQIYNDEEGLPPHIGDLLIKKYIEPYNEQFLDIITKPEVSQIIFCHTMPSLGTTNSLADDAGEYRPMFSLMNQGDKNGDNPEHPHFASGERIRAVGHIISEYIDALDTDFRFNEILTYNTPYPDLMSIQRFDPTVFEGKHPFCIEINRDLVGANLKNVPIIRHILCKIIDMLSDCDL